MTSSVVTLLKTDMLTLFLYHVILGRGNPVAEQFTRTNALIAGTSTVSGGVEVNKGCSEKKFHTKILMFESA